MSALHASAQQSSTPHSPATANQVQGKILFERSSADNTGTPTDRGNDPSLKSTITDADRASVAFTRYALDVRLQPEESRIAVRAQFTIRNDGDHPLLQVPLQLSSSLHWELLRTTSNSLSVRFHESVLSSDADHTGKLSEAAAALAEPLAPGSSASFDGIYSGLIPVSTKRLETIGSPAEVAALSDWDRVSPAFTGLRGFGNVVWYPVSSVPAMLGDGDKLFSEIGRVKMKGMSTLISISVTDEARGEAPTTCDLDGTVYPVDVTPGAGEGNLPSLIRCSAPEALLGFSLPSLAMATRSGQVGAALSVHARTDDQSSGASYAGAATMLDPVLSGWLGKPKRVFNLFDLPAAGYAPAETGSTLFTSLESAAATKLADNLCSPLTRAYFRSARPWLQEGVAEFMSTVWTEQSQTRQIALSHLDSERLALALAESSESGAGLLHTSEAVFYRTKAAYVFWMLRGLIGDTALQSALKLYDPAADLSDNYFEDLVHRVSNQDLHWLFDDWVYHDRGLPDLAITAVVPNSTSERGTYIVSVTVKNDGAAAASVPITLFSEVSQVTDHVLVPAHGNVTRRLLIESEPTRVQVNDGTVPELQASEHLEEIHYAIPKAP